MRLYIARENEGPEDYLSESHLLELFRFGGGEVAGTTELEDEKGNSILHLKVNKVEYVHGISFATEQETDADSPAGRVTGKMKNKNFRIYKDISAEFER